jgi:glutamate dehydrogenase (NAD(P)+)
VFVVGCEAARDLNIPIEGARVVVQGFGNVGGTAARLFHDAGAKVIAVQDHTACLHNSNGLNIPELQDYSTTHGGIAGAPNAETLSADDFWALETELLIPAALEGQLNSTNAGNVRARIVVEGANGPTTPEADDILAANGTLVVPDVLANAGGVTVSYFEWVQDFSSFYWTEPEINHRLEAMMRSAYASVAAVAREHRVSQRTAAFITACTRILEARELRGLYP